MHYRPLGKTGVQVSEIGMGCNRLGETAMPDSHWVSLVQAAAGRGVTLFDTSESYNWGRSEEMLGLALGNRKDVLVADKVSRVRDTNKKDFSAARIVARAEESLRKLRRDCIDVYQLHSPNLKDLQTYDWPDAMAQLKREGKIRFVGVSINDGPSGRWLIEQGLADVLQVPYNLLEPEVGREVFPLAERAGVGVLVRMPMAQGILTGKFRPGEQVAPGHRAHMAGERMGELIERAEAFRSLAARAAGGPSASMGQFAMRYAISPRAVSAAIPGARSVEQLEQNVAASNGTGLPAEVLEEIERIQAAW